MASAARPRTRLIKDASVLAMSGAFGQAAGLLGTMILARLLAPTELGTYQQLLLVFGIASPLLFGGVPTGLTYLLARGDDPADRRHLVFTGYVVLTGLGAVAALLMVAVAGPLASAFDNAHLDTALILYAPYVFGVFISTAMASVLVPCGYARLSAIVSAGGAAASLVATVIGGVAGGASSIALALSVYSLAYAAVTFGVVRRSVGVSIDLPQISPDARRMLAYGIPLAMTGLAGILGYQFDRLVVSSRFSPAEYTVYALGAVELPITIIVSQAINSVLLPELAARHAAGDLAGMSRLWRNAVDRTSLILLPVFVLCMVLAGDVIRVLFGSTYDDSTSIFRIYLLMLPFRVATYGLLPMAIGKTRINLSASIVVLASNAVLAIALVGPLGLKGPALASVLSLIITIAFYFLRLRSVIGIGLHTLFPWRIVGRNLGLSAIAGVVLIPVVLLPLPAAVALLIGGLLYTPAVVVVLRRAGAVAPEEWAALRAMIPALGRAR